MNIKEYYKVYTLNPLLGNRENLSLEEVQFKGSQSNHFNSEKEAVETMIKDEMCWQDYVILKHVYITDYPEVSL